MKDMLTTYITISSTFILTNLENLECIIKHCMSTLQIMGGILANAMNMRHFLAQTLKKSFFLTLPCFFLAKNIYVVVPESST